MIHKGAILAVDDTHANLKLLMDILAAEGYQVRPADSGEIAMASVVASPPELILLDIRMPGMDGFEVLRRLKAREESRDVPVIFLSAVTEVEQRVEGLKLGAVDFISKPFQREELLARVRTHLELFQLRARLGHQAADLRRANDSLEEMVNKRTAALHSEIAERKSAETALQAKNEELNAVLQQLWQAAKLVTMGELASSIAHELNNPLATVSLRIESLTAQTSQDDPRLRELEIIGQEVERMGNLVTNLLQFSRRSQQQISTVDVCEEIEKTFELIEYHLRKNNVKIIREFAPDVPNIHADRQQLRQLFLNLFTNAGDAMPQGGTLTVRVMAFPEAKQVYIEIADSGIGIAPEILPKVMEAFFTTKPEGKGTGLGLAICRRIAQEHLGTFDISSEGIPGKGTKVRITLSSTNPGNSIGLTDT